ncbi:MAG: hypothetical protein JM58_01280 [Peptococcaceae bacterium BICA1-8]|nr:MAG: hypothetical protein JM58_01280 [Peptococcaceae bacterium BICA1-8]
MGSKVDVLLAIGLLIVEVFLWVYIGDAPQSARSYPRALLDIAFILTLILLFTSFRKKVQEAKPGSLFNNQVLLIMLITGVYIAVLNYLGFALSTLIYIFGVMWYLGIRKKIMLILVPTLTTLFVYLVFNQLLLVLLPEGIFFGG